MTDRMTGADFHPRILEIFDGYVHGRISKCDFMTQAAQFAGAGMTAAAIVELLRPNYALAQQVAPDDPSIRTEIASYESPDGLSALDGYPGDDEKGREMQASLDPAKLMEDFFAAFEFLRDHPDSTGKVGVVGFCCGGGVANGLAVAYPDLAAAVPFYGRQPRPEQVARIQTPLLPHYAETDANVNAGWPEYEAGLKAAGKDYRAFIYPGTQHGFHNDTTPRYDREAAELAWQRTLDFFAENLN